MPSNATGILSARPGRFPARWLIALALLPSGCESGLAAIDRQTQALLDERTASIQGEVTPRVHTPAAPGDPYAPPIEQLKGPGTTNPTADEIHFEPLRNPEEVIQLVRAGGLPQPDAIELSMQAAIAYAFEHAREYRDAEEAMITTALQLLIEEHRWGPRFFDEVRAEATAVGEGGMYDSAVNVINEFRVSQQLPFGGNVSASLLAGAVEDLHQFVVGEQTQDATIVLAAELPLLRGAGTLAQEPRIQAHRNLVYAAREFERFRRDFYNLIAVDYLDLIVLQEGIINSQRQVESFKAVEARERALVESGREPSFQAAQAAQDTLFALDSLTSSYESFRLAVDRFKVRIGMPQSEQLKISQVGLDLPPPAIDADGAVRAALGQRLDLQTRRDQVDDSRRAVAVAENQTLPDLALSGNATLPTDPSKSRGGLGFDGDSNQFSAGLRFDVGLDRQIERIQLRQAQINEEQAERALRQFEDQIAVEVRASVRGIARSLSSVQLQEENVKIAERRQESIDAAPERADIRDRRDALDALLRAQDGLAESRRDLQVSILRYLLATDELRIGPGAEVEPLSGMPR